MTVWCSGNPARAFAPSMPNNRDKQAYRAFDQGRNLMLVILKMLGIHINCWYPPVMTLAIEVGDSNRDDERNERVTAANFAERDLHYFLSQ